MIKPPSAASPDKMKNRAFGSLGRSFAVGMVLAAAVIPAVWAQCPDAAISSGSITFVNTSKGCGVNTPSSASAAVALMGDGKLVLLPAPPVAASGIDRRLPCEDEAGDGSVPAAGEAFFEGAGDMSAGSWIAAKRRPAKPASK